MAKDYDGLVLRTVNYGEGNKILDVFTSEKGKLTVIARNIREFKKSKGKIAEPFCRLNMNLYRGKKFYYLNQSNIIESYSGIREDIDRMYIAAYISEMTYSAIESEEENRILYELINKTFKLLSEGEIDCVNLLFSYQIKFLSFIGYKPILNNIDIKSENFYFNYEDGSVFPKEFKESYRYYIEIENNIYKLLKIFLYSRLEDLRKIDINKYERVKIEHILYNYMVFHIGKYKYKSLKMLKTLDLI
ncbi:MAG: DNA repair protein RecO [Andreesenia angusta]|nr:DNA repair protein RecO [Andreesenia angusta]